MGYTLVRDFFTVERLGTALRALWRGHNESIPRGLLALDLNARGVNMVEWHGILILKVGTFCGKIFPE